MREISKRSRIYVGTKMVSSGIKGSPSIYESSLPKFRRVVEFLYISRFLPPPLHSLSVLGKAKFSFIFQRVGSSIVRSRRLPQTPSVIYILSRVFSFIRHVPRFFPAGNNTFDSPPVYSTPLSTPVVARTHRFPSRR